MGKLFSWHQGMTLSMTLIDRLVYLVTQSYFSKIFLLDSMMTFAKNILAFSILTILITRVYKYLIGLLWLSKKITKIITFVFRLGFYNKCKMLLLFRSLILKIFYLHFSHGIVFVFMLGLSYVSPFLICLLADNIILFFQHIVFSHH